MATIERESLGFGDLHLARGGHVADFFETDQQGLDRLVSYIKTGLEAGQRCIHFVGTERERDRVFGALRAADVDVDAAGAEELLTIVVRALVEDLDNFLPSVLADVPLRYPLVRLSGEIGSQRDPNTVWHDWCSTINTLDDAPALFLCLCQCEIQRVHGDVVLDVMRTHPMCILSNAIHQNPMYGFD